MRTILLYSILIENLLPPVEKFLGMKTGEKAKLSLEVDWMADITALVLLLLVLGTSFYAVYKGLVFPLVVKPMLKPKKPPS